MDSSLKFKTRPLESNIPISKEPDNSPQTGMNKTRHLEAFRLEVFLPPGKSAWLYSLYKGLPEMLDTVIVTFYPDV